MDYQAKSREVRRDVLTLIHKAQTSHAASNLSVIDIATVLYDKLKEGDEVVWSAGWKAATIYYFLYKQGKITEKELSRFPKEPYYGLAETTVNGVLCNGGSVGHGLPIAIGMAYAKKLSGEKGNIYCIVSDGELNEGTVWESAMLANQLKLDNLVVFIDKNGWQAMGKTKDVIDMEPLGDKWRAFGWRVSQINGHDHNQIADIWATPLAVESDKPLVVIAQTVKGKGVSFMENHLLFHYKHITDEEYKKLMIELCDCGCKGEPVQDCLSCNCFKYVRELEKNA